MKYLYIQAFFPEMERIDMLSLLLNRTSYVKILSGWTSYPTFLKFKPSSLNNFNGYCVAISD